MRHMSTHARHRFTVQADFNQFFVQDANADVMIAASPHFWNARALSDGLACARDTIAVGTASFGDVAVETEVLPDEPREAFDEWDQVADCALEIASGTLLIRSATQESETAARLELEAGTYRVRVFYGGLEADDSDAEDRYKIVLWLGEWMEPQVLKRFGADDAN